MNIILLSGGSGKRLWPLSNDIRSKQFIKLFRCPEQKSPSPVRADVYESMLQRVYRQIKKVNPDASVTVAAGSSQVPAIINQLGTEAEICPEPCRRDTFAAIVLAAAYLHDEKGVPEDEAAVVCPVDPYVEDDYFLCVRKLFEAAGRDPEKLFLMGIRPTYPSEKYGYIRPRQEEDGNISYTFTEKPDREKAAEYIAGGALWNSGVFAFKLSYVLKKAREQFGTDSYGELFHRYHELKKISFDYAVAEQETSIRVLRYAGTWKDLGTWNTLTEEVDEKVIGDAKLSDTCENVHVINELDVPVLVMGLKNAVVAASPEGILVSDKKQSSYIKPYTDAIDRQVMFAEKSWGSYRVMDVGKDSMTVKVTLNPGHKMNYHSHMRRDEVWTVIEGSGKTIVDGMEQPVRTGDVITMAAGCRHTVIAGRNGIQMIEVQLGRDISADDKTKYEMPYVPAGL